MQTYVNIITALCAFKSRKKSAEKGVNMGYCFITEHPMHYFLYTSQLSLNLY